MPASELSTQDSALHVVFLTPPGRSAVAGLALAGEGAAAFLGRHFTGSLGGGDGAVHYGRIVAGGDVLDEALVVVRTSRHVEIFCHGGAQSTARILAFLEGEGALLSDSPASLSLEEKGLDRVQREADALLGKALTARALRMLLAQRAGALSRWGKAVAGLLAAGDARSGAELRAMHGRGRAGRALVEARTVAIAGPANAGKSTLFNRLLGQARAVVSENPGTTRDPVPALAQCEGVPVRLVDTAGLGEPADALDRESQEAARRVLARADAVLAVFDGAAPDFPISRNGWSWLESAKTCWVRNKSDLLSPSPFMGKDGGDGWFSVSALTGEGVEALGSAIVEKIAGLIPAPGEACLFTARQEEIVRRAEERAAAGDFPAAASAIESLINQEGPQSELTGATRPGRRSRA